MNFILLVYAGMRNESEIGGKWMLVSPKDKQYGADWYCILFLTTVGFMRESIHISIFILNNLVRTYVTPWTLSV